MGANGRLKKQIQKNQQQEAAPSMAGPGGATMSMPQEQGGTLSTAQQAADPNQQGQMDEAKIRQMDDAIGMFMKLIHSEDTRDSVMQTLKSNPDPGKAIPAAANMLMNRVEGQAGKRNLKLPNDIKIASVQYIIQDLAMLGNKAGAWERPVNREDMPKILQDTVQIYIRKGLKDGTIDPVELQTEVEELMSPEQKAMGMQFGQSAGANIPPGPTPQMAVDKQVNAAVSKEKAKTEQARAQAEALKGNIRGAAAGSQQAQQTEQNAALQGR